MSHPIDREALARRILAVLEKRPGLTTDVLLSAVGGKDAHFREVLRQLEAVGAVRKVQLAGHGHGWGWYPTTVGSAGRAALDELSRLAQDQGLYPSGKAGDTDRAPPLDQTEELHQRVKSGRFDKLVSLFRNGPVPLVDVCDRLDLSPSKAKALLEDARAAGIDVHAEHDHVGFLATEQVQYEITEVPLLPASGHTYRVGIIGDTHMGSKYALRDALSDFVEHCKTQGVTTILHCGDWTDGCYRHGTFEVTVNSLPGQLDEAAKWLPRGVKYIGISGNHDHTWTDKTGFSFAHALNEIWRKHGRDDVQIVGQRAAFVRIGGCLFHLWHPKRGPAYALSYNLQRRVAEYMSLKPHVLAAGHWHRYCHVYERGIECLAVPCFQGGQSDFAKSLGGMPAIGGLIVEWQQNTGGAIRDFAVRPRRYFERETVYEVKNDLGVREIPPTVTEAEVQGKPSQQWHSCTGRAA